MANPDIVIIGSGIGGATLAAGLAPAAAPGSPSWSAASSCRRRRRRATPGPSSRGHFRPEGDVARGATGQPFNPGNYYYVGGNSKFYGAVLLRYRKEDFAAWSIPAASRRPGRSPMTTSSPGTPRPSGCSRSAATLGEDPTEPPLRAYPFPPVPDERADRRGPRAAEAPRPASRSRCRSASTSTAGCAGGQTPGMLSPTPAAARSTPRPARCRGAAGTTNIDLVTGAHVDAPRAAPDGKTHRRVDYRQNGEPAACRAKLVILSAGAVNSAALLLASARQAARGLANRSDHGRPQLHEPQLHGHAGDRPAQTTTRSTRRRWASTTSISPTATAARRSATSSSWARSPARSSESNLRWAPEFRARMAEPRTRRLVL